MPNETFSHFVQFVFSVVFVLSMAAGLLLFLKQDQWFGEDPEMPSENASSRAYSRIQVFIVWAHVFLLSGAFAFMLH